MKDIPIVFPISLVVIVVIMFFSGAYAIAEGATGGPAAESNLPHVSADADWFQSAAIWVCPLH